MHGLTYLKINIGFVVLQSAAELEGHPTLDSPYIKTELSVRCKRSFPLDDEWRRSGIQSPLRVRGVGRRCDGGTCQAVADGAGKVPL